MDELEKLKREMKELQQIFAAVAGACRIAGKVLVQHKEPAIKAIGEELVDFATASKDYLIEKT